MSFEAFKRQISDQSVEELRELLTDLNTELFKRSSEFTADGKQFSRKELRRKKAIVLTKMNKMGEIGRGTE